MSSVAAAETVEVVEAPFAIAHCATCHVTRNLASSNPLTGELIQRFRAEHPGAEGHRVTLRLL